MARMVHVGNWKGRGETGLGGGGGSDRSQGQENIVAHSATGTRGVMGPGTYRICSSLKS